MSGAELTNDGGGGVYLEIGSRRGGKRERGGESERRVSNGTRRYEAGEAPNARGFWKVEAIVEVRRRGGRARQTAGPTLEARIRWHSTNLATGLPWRDDSLDRGGG